MRKYFIIFILILLPTFTLAQIGTDYSFDSCESANENTNGSIEIDGNLIKLKIDTKIDSSDSNFNGLIEMLNDETFTLKGHMKYTDNATSFDLNINTHLDNLDGIYDVIEEIEALASLYNTAESYEIYYVISDSKNKIIKEDTFEAANYSELLRKVYNLSSIIGNEMQQHPTTNYKLSVMYNYQYNNEPQKGCAFITFK